MTNNAAAAQYKTVQIHLALTKSISYEKIILITNIQANTTPILTNFKDWMHCVITKMDFNIYADGVLLLSYVLQAFDVNVSFKDVDAAT